MNDIESLELKISKFLRYGVIFAGTLILVGWIKIFKWDGNPFYVFDLYDPIPFTDLFKFYISKKRWGPICIYFGLISLIALPVIRVFLTAFLFIKQKEYILAAVAGFVLLVLIGSFFLGINV